MVSKLTDIMDMILSLRRNHLKNRKELIESANGTNSALNIYVKK